MKKPASERDRLEGLNGCQGFVFTLNLREYSWDIHIMWVVPLYSFHSGAAAYHAIQFVDHDINCFETIVRMHSDNHIGAMDFYMPFGCKLLVM